VLTWTSIFFMNNPDTSDPVYALTSLGVNNYVTLDPTWTAQLMIAQKSDIKDPLATNPATQGNITLKQLLTYLRYMFNVYYSVDAGVLKLEHISYFENYAVIVDLTTYVTEQLGCNEYDHLKQEIPRRENFTWMESKQIYNDDFRGVPIEYSEDCSSDGEKSYPVDRVTTDILFVTDWPDMIADDGFVIIATRLVSGTYYINVETGLLSGATKMNGHLSWANLQYNYHRHNRYLPSGNMNRVDENFISWRPNIRQQQFDIPLCCGDTFNPQARFLTTLSQRFLSNKRGTVTAAEFNLEMETIKLTMAYSI
jgi:hypothetical protein